MTHRGEGSTSIISALIMVSHCLPIRNSMHEAVRCFNAETLTRGTRPEQSQSSGHQGQKQEASRRTPESTATMKKAMSFKNQSYSKAATKKSQG